MKIIAIQSSPNDDGLTAKTAKAVIEGAKTEGASVELVNLNEVIVKPCMACDGGWGQCRREGTCVIDDEFQSLRDKIHAADALVFATPVYWGDLSESAKLFLDRLRRTEVKSEFKALNGRYALGIASAGGTGNGCVKVLSSPRGLSAPRRIHSIRPCDRDPGMRKGQRTRDAREGG